MAAGTVSWLMRGDTEASVATTDLEAEYEILGELGRGATAVVYRARDRELGREVAIKVIRPKYADDDETVARLAREARTVAQLQHSNIVTLFAVRRIRDGGLALVMQLVPGKTLRELLNERGPLSFERADRVLRDVASALAHAHQRGIVHRDVKPENIFIDDRTGHAMLSDFGVARTLEADSQLTATGMAIGTPAYMSPEQIDGTAIDGRSDVYSLGLVAWEMLTGQRPWEGESLYSVIYKQKREELQPIEELRPDTPDRLIYLVEGAIRKDAAERWRGASELLERASTIAPEGGWRRWHAERRKRRRSAVYHAARDRGDSILGAALETVRFRRDGTTPVPRVEPRLVADVGSDHETQHDDDPGSPLEAPRRPRRLVPVLALGVVVVAAVIGSARLMQGRMSERPPERPPAAFADNGGVEVPVARPSSPAPAPPAETSTVPPSRPDAAADASPTPVPNERGLDSTTSGLATASVRQPSPSESSASSSNTVRPPSPRDATPSIPVPSAPALVPPSVAVVPSRDSTTDGPPAPAAGAVTFPAERGTIAAGGRHSCAIDDGGKAVCWGANDQGQLGDGSHEDHVAPAAVAGDLSFAQVNAGASHTCGVTRDGDAYCWGNNERGQLGDATTLQRDTPVRVGASGAFKTVRAGFSHSCALSRAGEIWCWGSNAYGQLGTGGGLTSSRPGVVAGGRHFGALAVGWNHTCGITPSGEAYCWGSNNAGQLGDGTRDDRRVPTPVAGTARFVSIAAGNQHTCAVSTTGDVYCWGRNNYGQLATGAGDRSQPAAVDAGAQFATVTAGAVHTCARTTSGQVFCWGRNTFGQLGDGTTTDRASPVRVAGMPAVAVVEASGAHTCAATANGEDYCWGYNVEGQVGDGTRNHRLRPVRVTPPSR